MTRDYDAIAESFAALVVAAGAVVMEVFRAPTIETRFKSDKSPVSDADEQAEALLLEGLARQFPDLPVVAEESAARGAIPAHGDVFLLVDPLDGTREFIRRAPDFTVNIALVEGGRPRAGAVFAPATNELWFGGTRAFAATAAPGAPLPERKDWREIHVRPAAAPPDALVSRSHLEGETLAFLDKIGARERQPMGSSLKFCRIAEGAADVYARFGPTMEWDIAAGDAILTAAGGAVFDPAGAPLRYGKREAGYRAGAFIAWGDPSGASA